MNYHPHAYEPDQLDGLIQQVYKQYASSSSWGEFIHKSRGIRDDLHPNITNNLHSAARLLSQF